MFLDFRQKFWGLGKMFSLSLDVAAVDSILLIYSGFLKLVKLDDTSTGVGVIKLVSVF
jgi:hypothetical protein